MYINHSSTHTGRHIYISFEIIKFNNALTYYTNLWFPLHHKWYTAAT